MAAISITAANVIPSNNAVIVRTNVAGVSLTAGQAVYLAATGVWQQTNAAAVGTAACGGLTLNTAAAGQLVAVVVSDPALVLGGTVAAGDTIWTSPTAGGVTKTQADLVTGTFTTILGVAVSATKISLNIIPSGVAHA